LAFGVRSTPVDALDCGLFEAGSGYGVLYWKHYFRQTPNPERQTPNAE
jgi:hypothetical protein